MTVFSPDTDQKEREREWRENSKVERREIGGVKQWERYKLFSQDSSTPHTQTHISHSPRSCHITIGLIYYSFHGQDRVTAANKGGDQNPRQTWC